ncbi:MAG: peptidylprolyl isomerase [Rhizobiaceae bacterium]|nr:peptidylprolyl isomerase [Rhizobiaceae bacterium]
MAMPVHAQDQAAGSPAAEAPAATVDPATVVATVDGQPVTEGDLVMALQDLGEQFARVPEDKRRAAALQAIIEIRLMAARGRADGIDKTPEFQSQIGFLTDRVLHQSVIDAEVAGKITEEDIRARYDQEVAARPAENEVKARHILVETEEAAKKLIADLDGGAEFEKLAGENTTDPSGKDTGGDLGWFGAGMMVPEFEKAAFETEPGSYTKTPVKTQFGFHIIKVEDKRVKQPPEFDSVRDQVRSIVIRERYLALVDEMRKAAKVEVTDAALKADLDAQQ